MTKPSTINSLNDLFRAYGIHPMEHEGEPVWEAVGVEAYSAQEEIGVPGTRIISGRISTEQNPRLRPYLLRGRLGNPGLTEHTYRTEPVVFKSVNEITSLIDSATLEPRSDETLDPETAEITDRAHRAIRNIRSKFSRFKRDASTCVKHGFAPFEAIWDEREDGSIYIHDLKFREQSTVEQWKFDERQSDLLGGVFRTLVTGYELPAGDTIDEARLFVVTLNGHGNNIEGISPVRVCVGLRKLKELLLSIVGVSYQKFGVPIAQILEEIADYADARAGTMAASDADKQKLANRLKNVRATIGPVLTVPAGLKVEYANPTVTMPDIKPMLEYLDALMALVFSNEGALLGSQSFGSYAMAAVSDNKFMRSAPAYVSPITDMLTDLLHLMIRWNHSDPDSIEVLPYYGFRFAGTQDSSKWTADMRTLVESEVWTWPDEARKMAAANMGLSVSAFDTWGSTVEAMGNGVEE